MDARLVPATVTRIDQVPGWHAAREPSAPCLRWRGDGWSYAQVERLVGRLADCLRDAGIEPGDRVAVLCTPRPEYLLLMLAITRVGALYVGLNPRYSVAECRHVLETVRPRLVFALRAFEHTDFTSLLAQAQDPACPIPVIGFDHVDDLIAGIRPGAAVIALGAAVVPSDPRTREALRDGAVVVFTSGTTGKPKAAMLSHEGLLLAARVQHDRLNPPRPRYLCNLPINHVGGVMNLTLGCLVGGGTLVFQERFDPGEALRLLIDESVNCWVQVPAMFHACVSDPAFDPNALLAIRSICAGGGPLSANTLAALRRIGARLFVEYGQTETSSSATYTDPQADDDVLLHTIGRFDPAFEFRIVDERNQPCSDGAIGEIQARGPLLFRGYFDDPVATRAAFTDDGWLHTGDLAARRRDGNLVLSGRLKELIKTGGYNVYPREVELVLESHPSIVRAVVVGAPDEQYGEQVCAVIEASPPIDDPTVLRAHCARTLANYKWPRRVITVSSLPLLPNGKLDRVRAREIAVASAATR